MQFLRFTNSRLAVGLMALIAAASVATANDRGPIQTQFSGSDRLAAPALTAVSSSESGHIDATGVSPADRSGRYLYIVRFDEPSLARYEGGIEDLAPTSPRVTGERLNTRSSAALAYRGFLAQRHDDYLGQIGQFVQRELRPTHQFLNALNGMTLRLTPAEAELVAGLPFIAGIEIDRVDELHTDEGPALIRAPEVWAGDTISGLENRGEGIIIGVMDTGFNHGHPSFTEIASDGYEHVNPFGEGVFVGLCSDPGAPDYEDVCNNKVIGTHNLHPDSTSSDDTDSHGTHVASTAGGNPLSISFPFQYLNLDVDISGVAPRANLINYKVCEPTCPAASRVAAVDLAIDQGVHVLNHSIGNNEPPWASAVSLAFLDANAAGIVVAASAGNSGPGASTAASTGPWNMAVGASTHQRRLALFANIAADPTEYPGSAAGLPLAGPFSGNLRYAGDVDAANFEGCNAFPANAFDGEAALIRRGGCTFAAKVDNAVAAGAVFVVIANNQAGIAGLGGLEAATVSVLSISQASGDTFIAAINGDVATLGVQAIIDVDSNNADTMAGFSSRGPASHNTLTPAITAPGVQILAGAMDESGQFIAIGGTSMSSPHVAGAAALMMAEHPSWSPTEIRSALTLAANPNHRKEDGSTPADPFDMGSGRLDVAAAANVGFVMDESIANFVAANPAEGGDPSTLNLSSIKSDSCVSNCSFQRTIRSVVDQAVDYTVSANTNGGASITVTPSTFTLNPGAELTLDIDINVTGETFDEWFFAAIDIQQDAMIAGDPEPLMVANARMPVAVMPREPKPTIVIAPQSLSSTQQRNEVTEQQFGIFNEGALPLEWSLNELGPQAGQRAEFSAVIWDNPQMGTSGRINNFSIPDDTGIYQSDAFAILAPSSVETIFSAGFILGTPGVTDLVWMVFPDNNGVPAGDPENNPGAAIWSFSAATDDPGVSFVDAAMSLDLAAAGAPALDLDPGVYWLVAYPTVQLYSLGPNNLYAWFNGESVATGRQIGPGGLSGFPTSWAGAPEGRAFTLTGTVDCSAAFNPWTNVSPTSGTIDPGESDVVNVEFHSVGMQEGTFNSAFCVISNDPEAPVTLMPVQLNVVNLPSASISPDNAAFSVEFGATDSGQVVISNSGLGELDFSVRGAGNTLRGSSTLIYDQTASQTTQGSLAIYDLDGPETWAVQAADDFSVPVAETWTIDQVVANGFYDGLINPATSVRVFFYEDDNGQPGSEIISFMGLAPSNDDAGVLTFDLPQTVSLGTGTYWLSVQPEMDFFADGRWFWFQNSEQVGNEAHWRNPGDGYGTGCVDWGTFSDCGFVNPDSSFQLFGQAADSCQPIDTIAWLAVDPESGTVAPEGGSQAIDLLVNGGAVQPGSYEATICFDTNDGDNPALSVDVTLDVTGVSPDLLFGDRFEGANND